MNTYSNIQRNYTKFTKDWTLRSSARKYWRANLMSTSTCSRSSIASVETSTKSQTRLRSCFKIMITKFKITRTLFLRNFGLSCRSWWKRTANISHNTNKKMNKKENIALNWMPWKARTSSSKIEWRLFSVNWRHSLIIRLRSNGIYRRSRSSKLNWEQIRRPLANLEEL